MKLLICTSETCSVWYTNNFYIWIYLSTDLHMVNLKHIYMDLFVSIIIS